LVGRPGAALVKRRGQIEQKPNGAHHSRFVCSVATSLREERCERLSLTMIFIEQGMDSDDRMRAFGWKAENGVKRPSRGDKYWDKESAVYIPRRGQLRQAALGIAEGKLGSEEDCKPTLQNQES
jgi:hypothetical protein